MLKSSTGQTEEYLLYKSVISRFSRETNRKPLFSRSCLECLGLHDGVANNFVGRWIRFFQHWLKVNQLTLDCYGWGPGINSVLPSLSSTNQQKRFVKKKKSGSNDILKIYAFLIMDLELFHLLFFKHRFTNSAWGMQMLPRCRLSTELLSVGSSLLT